MNPCRTQKDRIKFCPTKMKNENLIAIFEESGSSMTSVTNENESTRRKWIQKKFLETQFLNRTKKGARRYFQRNVARTIPYPQTFITGKQ